MSLEEIVAKIAESKPATKVAKIPLAGFTVGVIPHIVPKQDVIDGIGSVKRIPGLLKRANVRKPLIVTDATLVKLGVINGMLDALKAEGFDYAIYDGVEPNPSIENIEDAFALYRTSNCDSLIGFGGGSAMDASKVVSCRAVMPNTSVKEMGRLMGYFPVTLSTASKKTPFMIAVPTTAGTGAESTVAAVVSDHKEDKKYTITDRVMRPNVVVLDPELAKGLPPYPTAVTGIDALSHCVEGYIGKGHNPRADEFAERGARLIMENLDTAFENGANLEARAALATAAYMGGQSLNFATTGYVHPFCHKIGAKYGLVHGRCIAAVLPIILEIYGDKVQDRLSKLAVACGVADPSASEKAQCDQFIQKLRAMNEKYGINPHIPEIQKEDYEEIADSIMVENFVYPTREVFTREEIYHILDLIKG